MKARLTNTRDIGRIVAIEHTTDEWPVVLYNSGYETAISEAVAKRLQQQLGELLDAYRRARIRRTKPHCAHCGESYLKQFIGGLCPLCCRGHIVAAKKEPK